MSIKDSREKTLVLKINTKITQIFGVCLSCRGDFCKKVERDTVRVNAPLDKTSSRPRYTTQTRVYGRRKRMRELTQPELVARKPFVSPRYLAGSRLFSPSDAFAGAWS